MVQLQLTNDGNHRMIPGPSACHQRAALADRRQPLLATTPRVPQRSSTTPTSSGCAARLLLRSLVFGRVGQACGTVPAV